MKDKVSDLDSLFESPSVKIHALDTYSAADCLLRLLYHIAPAVPQSESTVALDRPLFDIPNNVFTCTQDVLVCSFLQEYRHYTM